MLGEGNFGKVWKAEVDDICGYEGTILVAVKGVKASCRNKQKHKHDICGYEGTILLAVKGIKQSKTRKHKQMVKPKHDICGYEGTLLVAVKGVKASLKNKQKTQTRTTNTNTKSVNTTAFYLSLPWELRQLMIMFVKSIL